MGQIRNHCNPTYKTDDIYLHFSIRMAKQLVSCRVTTPRYVRQRKVLQSGLAAGSMQCNAMVMCIEKLTGAHPIWVGKAGCRGGEAGCRGGEEAGCRKDATIGSRSAANHDLCIQQMRLRCPARKVSFIAELDSLPQFFWEFFGYHVHVSLQNVIVKCDVRRQKREGRF